jgi:ABC-type branched-subunit amino acid transport system substrate-binding protein
MATPYGEALKGPWAQEWEDIGITPVLTELIDISVMDYVPYAQKLKDAKPDIWWHGDYFAQGVQAWKAALSVGLQNNIKFAGIEAASAPERWTDPEQGGFDPEEVEGVLTYGAKTWSDKYHGGWADWFRQKYKERTGTSQGTPWAALGLFQAAELAIKAANNTNSLDSDVLAEYLRANIVTTAMYDVKFDEQGNNLHCQYTAVQWRNGVPKTVWPLDIAEGGLVSLQGKLYSKT